MNSRQPSMTVASRYGSATPAIEIIAPGARGHAFLFLVERQRVQQMVRRFRQVTLGVAFQKNERPAGLAM